MNPGCCQPEYLRRPAAVSAGFTLIEMLVVIAIIAALTALIAGLTTTAGIGKVRNRAMTELRQYELAIETYHKKFGLYPPDNPNPNGADRPPLYYELAGKDPIPPNLVAALGVNGIVNTNQNFIPNVSPNRWAPSPGGGPLFLIFDYKGPNGQYNAWNYRSSKPEHNTESFDLWIDVVVGGKTYSIGNWKE